MGDFSPERKSGCGLLGAVFGRPRKSPSPTPTQQPKTQTPIPNNDSSNKQYDHKNGDKIISRPGPNHKPHPVCHQSPGLSPNHNPQPVCHQSPGLSPNHIPQSVCHQSPGLSPNHQNPTRNAPPKAQSHTQARKVVQAGPGYGLSGELDAMIRDNQRSKGAGNMYSNLGNLRQPGNNDNHSSRSEVPSYKSHVVNKQAGPEHSELCRALSTRMDPEELKILGNEDYKNGRFEEALALYDAAISVDPNKASYRSNKSAALTSLGKLLEAAFECKEAIRIDPCYQRAHNRLATLYVRLGEPEKALYHFKHAGPEADPDAISTATKVQNHLNKCTEAKRKRDWNTLLKEINSSTNAGADSAPLILALKAEALLKLNRHEEAIQTMMNKPKFSTEECTKFFGPIASATLLISQAQVHIAEGRFDDASAAAERASRLDANNREASSVMRKARELGLARSKGNDHFKRGRFEEACVAYGEGLDLAPHNGLLLCNRAACQAKLGRYEKALEDCHAAIHVRPGYSKARLRRADCYAKMENWGACLQDCEVLISENPDDREVARLLNEAKARLNH